MTTPTLLADVEDFEARHGPADDKVEALLEDATALILEEVNGSEAEWVTDDVAEVPPLVVATCIQIAYRTWMNPDGLADERLGAASRTYRGSEAPDVLYLTQKEARRLRKAAKTSGLSSIPLETPYSGTEAEVSNLDFWPL